VIADVVGCVEAPDVADRAIDLGRDLYVHGSLLDVPEMADLLVHAIELCIRDGGLRCPSAGISPHTPSIGHLGLIGAARA
jgi:hypothetical protein